MNDFDQNKIYFESIYQYYPSNADFDKVLYDDQYQLERLATQYKREGDWGGALACLYYIKNELEEMEDYRYCELALKLALYLQSAGKFDEAKFELQLLLNSLDYISEIKVIHHKDKDDFNKYIEWSRYTLLSQIFDTARKIYKREKLSSEAKEFESYSISFRNKAQECNKYFSEQSSIRVEEYRKQRIQRKEEEKQQENDKQQKNDKPKPTPKQKFFWWSVLVGLIIAQIIRYLTK